MRAFSISDATQVNVEFAPIVGSIEAPLQNILNSIMSPLPDGDFNVVIGIIIGTAGSPIVQTGYFVIYTKNSNITFY